MPGTILIVAGGTGGHLYPGVALARTLKARGWTPAFAVRRGDLGRDVLSREGFEVHDLTGQGWPRKLSFKTLTFPFKVLAGYQEAVRLIERLRPKCVVGMGGYLSFPVLIAARRAGVPTLIHEQNVVPGLANKFLARWVDGVAVSFAASRTQFANPALKVTGLPIRNDIGGGDRAEARRSLGLDPSIQTILVFGGSLGAHRLNMAMIETWKSLAARRTAPFQIIHVTGEKDYSELKQPYGSLPMKFIVLPYCHTMAAAYASADVVLCRSGASTIAELVAVGRPAVLVPYPFASANHQLANAHILADAGLAKIVLDSEISAERLATELAAVLDEGFARSAAEGFKRLAEEMHTADAALRLAQRVEILAAREN